MTEQYCLEKKLGVAERIVFILVGIRHKRYAARNGLNAGNVFEEMDELAAETIYEVAT